MFLPLPDQRGERPRAELLQAVVGEVEAGEALQPGECCVGELLQPVPLQPQRQQSPLRLPGQVL